MNDRRQILQKAAAGLVALAGGASAVPGIAGTSLAARQTKPLARPAELPDEQRINPPEVERAMVAFADILDAIEDLFLSHGLPCRCVYCDDLEGARFTLEVFESLLASEVYPSQLLSDRKRLSNRRAKERDAIYAARKEAAAS